MRSVGCCTALNSLAHEMKAQQRVLQGALDDAVGLKFTVHADGSVTYPAAGEGLVDGRPLAGGRASGVPNAGMASPSGLVAPHPNAAKAQDIADRIARAVRMAADADWRYANALRSLKAEEGLRCPRRDGDGHRGRCGCGAAGGERLPHAGDPA